MQACTSTSEMPKDGCVTTSTASRPSLPRAVEAGTPQPVARVTSRVSRALHEMDEAMVVDLLTALS